MPPRPWVGATSTGNGFGRLWEERRLLSYDLTALYKSVYNNNIIYCACWFGQALLTYDRPEDLYQAVGLLYSIVHIDIDNLTLSLLNITLPNLLLQSCQSKSGATQSGLGGGSGGLAAVGKFLNDPRGGAMAKLCVLCVNLMCSACQFDSAAGRWDFWGTVEPPRFFFLGKSYLGKV